MTTDRLIRTTREFIPTIYAYTTPGYADHDGWTKIGDTKRGAEKRIEEQLSTADINYKLEWERNATFEGSNETFRDYDFHAYMLKQGIERKKRINKYGKPADTEWFHIVPDSALHMLYDFRADRGILKSLGALPYTLRDEQCEAVGQTKAYFKFHDGKNPEFLWNAKPRFGKTLTAYDLCVALDATKILIVTNRPAIANSWYDDYVKFFGTESGYYFISSTDSLKGKPYVITREDFVKADVLDREGYKGCIEFVSLQDLKGSKYFGGRFDKLKHLYKGNRDGTNKGLTFDLLIIDEAHEGVDTYKTDKAFDQIDRKYTLHLSGTPFKALANDKFESAAIFNWTYADEQKAKRDWNDEGRSNPYAVLPKMNLLTYRMSDIVLDRLAKGADFDNDGDDEAYAFDLNEFFKTNESGNFIHDKDVDKFLDALVSQIKFPFSEEYRDELKHTLWVLKYVASAKALATKLKNHPVFKEYEIVLAAGDGKLVDDETELDDDEMERTVRKSYDKVVKAIAESGENGRTITLSVGQLTTGITIPEWTAVMMLSNMKSPSLYMQAAFRSQNPCVFKKGGKSYQKENAYIFDFDPARTLDIFEQFANGLYSETASGKGDSDTRKKHVRELINFFPVYGEDDEGEMIELDAEKVLSIPRAIHAKEVVRRGFMSNFLFQNISGIFAAPSVVTNILNKLEPVKEPARVTNDTKDDLSLNDDNEVEIPNETVIGIAKDVFGEKIYADIEIELEKAVEVAKAEAAVTATKDEALEKLKEAFHVQVTNKLTEEAKDNYGREMTKSTQASVIRDINRQADKEIEKQYGTFTINQTLIEDDRKEAVKKAKSEGRYGDVAKINAEAAARQEENSKSFESDMREAIKTAIEDAGKKIVNAVETDKKEKEKKSVEDKVRDHLRGFARTIPSFLMGYGDENTCLENFDAAVPSEVFLDVTGITIEQFVFLRDGGDYTEEETGENKHFEGHLFDPVVFNDSVKEFMSLRERLADYFNENAKEDIFDYIPPQKTNQIYTPKKIVKQMVDYLEQENPGCFDDPNATFIDLYMKSGLYITEIVKRLFNSEKIKKEFPDDQERLVHIFEKQVYGLAPTEIIYRIATNFILGFDKTKHICKHNLKQADALPNAKDGTLNELLDILYR